MRAPALRIALFFSLAASLAPTVAGAAPPVLGARPAIVIRTANLGKVIATPAKLGIYYWSVEKKAGGRVTCTGSCAVAWPPVFVKGAVPKHIKGVAATFGSIKRGARRQLTVNGLPAYTYEHDTAGVVLCDNVDGWFAVRPK